MAHETDLIDLLKSIDSHLHVIQTGMASVLSHIRDAEAEVPARMQRFTNYTHDVQAILRMYREHGGESPAWVKAEAERCDDRYRQVLAELHLDDGAFAKVRREMAKDPANRWDHTKQLKGPNDETGPSPDQSGRVDEGGA